MELINQRIKGIMEGCKVRARDSGLNFADDTLEYIVTNRDLLELSPKLMIPTLYDYWVHDVEILWEKGRYELYPTNPYETVINTRPAISFYNDNNPDWLNVMIFYHVLAHIDFFQNNTYFRRTWDYDFSGQALADKRLIAKLRSEKGRWVDYVIEFARAIDNIVAFHSELSRSDQPPTSPLGDAVNFYFDVFLQEVKNVSNSQYIKEIERFNACNKKNPALAEQTFIAEVHAKYPEFESLLERHRKHRSEPAHDLLQYIMKYSDFINKEENAWMLSVCEIVRSTSLFFQPQIRTKIMNEGWASYWHEKLFLADERIKGHEVDFARIHAGVVSLPRVGLNPYALGLRLFQYIEELGDTGRYSMKYRNLTDSHERKTFDTGAKNGNDFIFQTRKNLSDYLFIDTFVDQDFIDKHKLFVAGKRLNQAQMVWEYYVKSRSAGAYRRMLFESLYHPPFIEIDTHENPDNMLCLLHRFEGKPLISEYIFNTMLGIEFLWGGPVQLETSEPVSNYSSDRSDSGTVEGEAEDITWKRIRYTMKDRKLDRQEL